MFKSWYPSNTGCDGNCLILTVEREHSSSHQKPILAPVGYVQNSIPVEHWLWQKMSESHCRKGTLLISHQKLILGRVGYVQKLIPFKRWSWWKTADSHCWMGPLLVSLKTHIRTRWVCSKVDTHQTMMVMENGWFSLYKENTRFTKGRRNNGNTTEPNNSVYKVGTEVAGYIQQQQLSSWINQWQITMLWT
jgi:hypothetical protein